MINLDINTKIHNRFDIEVINAKTGEIKQRAQAQNVICNQLWDKLLANFRGRYFQYIHYGAGLGTPAPSDTSLFDFLAACDVSSGANIIAKEVDYENEYAYVTVKTQLAPETAVGDTLTEVGIASGSAADTLCTHAMLQDMNGNPISIVKTDTDVINIYATIYIHWDGDQCRAAKIYPVFYIGLGLLEYLTGRWGGAEATLFGNSQFSLASWYKGRLDNQDTWVPSGSSGSTFVRIGGTSTIDAANKTISTVMTRAAVDDANIGGITRIIHNRAKTQVDIGYPPLVDMHVGGSWYPRSTITGEAVGTGDGATIDFALDFPFAHNATIYVDGVAQQNVTVDYAPNTTNFAYAIIPIRDSAKFWPYFPLNYDDSAAKRIVLYNPAYVVGLGSIYANPGDVEASDDLSHWTVIGNVTSSGTFEIPAEYQHHKYYRCNVVYGSIAATAPVGFTGNVVHFPAPPSAGAVITADYQCDCIAKDSDHVFDLSTTFRLGEYTE